ncbi:hypothetical protein C8J56DRAFT_1058192 [Mycena floridula]|nr:hypothetical protein C8J56DRAFT_1058192 [Mycena floridula]
MPALIRHLLHTRTALAVRIGHCRRASPAPADVGHIRNRRRSRIDRTGRHQHPPPSPGVTQQVRGADEEALQREQSDAPEALEAVKRAEARELMVEKWDTTGSDTLSGNGDSDLNLSLSL